MILQRKKQLMRRLAIGLIVSVSTVAWAGRATVSWDPNTEDDLAGYKVYWGTQPNRNYTDVLDVGNVTSHTFDNLQEGQTYYFAVTAYDRAGNESGFSEEVSAEIPSSGGNDPGPGDTTAPELVNVTAMGETQVDVIFSEPLDRTSAETASHYAVSGSIQVIGAILDQSETVVHLVTSTHQRGVDYTLSVTGIEDKAGNVVASGSAKTYRLPDPTQRDTTPPALIYVVVVDPTHIDVIFSEAVGPSKAERAGNYDISNGIRVSDAKINDNQSIVRLTTSEHAPGQTYTLVVRNVEDLEGNAIQNQNRYTYTTPADGNQDDGSGDNNDDGNNNATPPTIVSVAFQGHTQIDVTFSETLDKASAENRQNYRIDNGIEVKGAILGADLATVHLLTSKHQDGVVYTLTVNNVRDQQGETIAADSRFQYSTGDSGDDVPDEAVSSSFSLFPNYPNPFNPETQIRFFLEKGRKVELKIYNPLGQLVRTLVKGELAAGHHAVMWDGTNDRGLQVPSGVYIYTLEVKRQVQKGDLLVNVSVERRVRKMTLIR